jgi:hypothetical protein
MQVVDFMHIPSQDNLADVLTKPLGGITFHRLVGRMLFRRNKLLAYANEWQTQGSSRCILEEKLNQADWTTTKQKKTTATNGPVLAKQELPTLLIDVAPVSLMA